VLRIEVSSGFCEWAFAKADGFNTPKDMFEWFAFTSGVCIYWENKQINKKEMI